MATHLTYLLYLNVNVRFEETSSIRDLLALSWEKGRFLLKACVFSKFKSASLETPNYLSYGRTKHDDSAKFVLNPSDSLVRVSAGWIYWGASQASLKTS